MLSKSLVLLTGVLHVLGLDQDRGREVDGGVKRGSRRLASRAALLAPARAASRAGADSLLLRTPCTGFAPPVLADAPSSALLALASHPPVLADLRAPALLAPVSHPPVLADARASALLALASLPPVLADAPSSALLALASHPPVLADLRAPHSLHLCRTLRARRCPSLRTPCTGFAASRARRCPLLRTPCTGFAPSRARRSQSPRTPCTCFAPSRARRSLSPGTPCSNILSNPCRARTSRRFLPPRRARTLPSARGAMANRAVCYVSSFPPSLRVALASATTRVCR